MYVVAVLLVVLGGRAWGTTLLVVGPEPPVLRTPDHRFSLLPELGYPWAPKYLHLEVPGYQETLRVHYIDEGPHDAPETMLLLHGTPSWSFLYRTMIPVFLSVGYRVVAIDQIGFGRSDKLTNVAAYSHGLHVATVQHVVGSLDLQGVTLVGHDLGGPTGVSALVREPERYRRLILLNTWLPQGDMLSSLRSIEMHLPYLLWRLVVTFLGRDTPVEAVFKMISDASPAAVTGGYGAPYPSSVYKAGPAFWPLMNPLSVKDPVALEMQRAAILLKHWKGPILLGYSDKEVLTTPGRPFLQRLLPEACDVTIRDAGHYLQEDQGPGLARSLISFMEHGCGVSH